MLPHFLTSCMRAPSSQESWWHLRCAPKPVVSFWPALCAPTSDCHQTHCWYQHWQISRGKLQHSLCVHCFSHAPVCWCICLQSDIPLMNRLLSVLLLNVTQMKQYSIWRSGQNVSHFLLVPSLLQSTFWTTGLLLFCWGWWLKNGWRFFLIRFWKKSVIWLTHCFPLRWCSLWAAYIGLALSLNWPAGLALNPSGLDIGKHLSLDGEITLNHRIMYKIKISSYWTKRWRA